MLHVTNFRSSQGNARVWVHTDSSNWYDGGSPWYLANHDINPDTDELIMTVEGVPSGIDVAVFVLHDKDSDGRADTFFGYPTEGMAVSNGARGGPFGGPKFSDAAVPTDVDVEPCMHMELEVWNP